MLVPIDAWDKMLLQLGNLHEAGQQLAEARERAAKAETEAQFLKERLTELRTELAESKQVEPRPHRHVVESEEAEPIAHIPIESDDDVESERAPEAVIENEPEPESERDESEIAVRDLGRERRDEGRLGPDPATDDMTLAEYSLEMMKHLYSTWRGRPRR
jgi:hypothetical protein